MIFSVSYNRIEWFIDFGPDSVALTKNDLVQEMKIGFQELLVAAWSFVLSQRRGFSNDDLARGSFNCKDQGTMEMRVEVLSSVEAENLIDTSGYQASHLEDIEFHWKDHDLEMGVVF